MAIPKIVPYTLKEKLLLTSLVDKHKNIVENKKTDAATIQLKQKEWEIIAFEYNSQGHIISSKRSAAQLKKLWNNLKQKKRKTNTEEKHTMLLTGGGPHIEFEKDPVMDAVDTAAPYADVTLSRPWDSTATYIKDMDIPESSNQVEIGEIVTEPQSEPNDNPVQQETQTSQNADFSPKTKNVKVLLQTESKLRIQKVNESMQQQTALHNIKMQIEEQMLLQSVAKQKQKRNSLF